MIEFASLVLALSAQVTAPPPPPVLASPSPAVSASPSPAVAPLLVAAPASIQLNPAQQQAVAIRNSAGPLSIVADRGLVTSVASPGSFVVTAGQVTGNDVLHVTDPTGARVDIPVRIGLNAGAPPDSATLRVTGSPIDPAWLASQAQALVSRLTLPTLRPGARLTVATPAQLPTAAPAVAIPVAAQVAGAGSDLDVAKTTNVSVSLVDAGPFSPTLLFYDDDPEHVTADGVLYRGTVSTTTPARLYFYHDSGPDPRRVVVLLSTSAQPATVQAIDATAGPNVDVMSVGHAVSRDFLVEKLHNQGIVVDVNPSQPFVLHDLPMSYRQGVSGSVGLNVLSGGPVTVTVVAVSPGVDPSSMLAAPRLPDDGHHRTGAFFIGDFGNDTAAYSSGGPDAKVVYADRSPSPRNVDPQNDGHDYGDYGVMHTITFLLDNPTASAANAYLYERPIGGIARSSFLVNGDLVEVGCVRRSIPYQIAAYTLPPGQRYRLVVQTMTDGGSNYPIEVGVSAIAPQPSAPPIASPDGCFPKAESNFVTPVPIITPTPRF